MYEITLLIHSLLRWLAILLPLYIFIRSAIAWSKNSAPQSNDALAIKANMIVYDIQLVIGFILYGVLSPITKIAFADFKSAMKNADLRFFAVEHLTIMIVAVILAHLLNLLPNRKEGKKKSLLTMILSLILLVVVIVGIPWARVAAN